MTAAFSAEATEASDDSPTLAQPTINAEKWQAFIPFSIELGQDYASLQEELGRLFADARDQLEASKFTNGAGAASNEPQGITVGGTATTYVDTAGTAAFVAADVYTLQQALPPRFQPRASFLSSNTTGNTIWRFVAAGSTTEAVLFNDDRSMLLGKPWGGVAPRSSRPPARARNPGLWGLRWRRTALSTASA